MIVDWDIIFAPFRLETSLNTVALLSCNVILVISLNNLCRMLNVCRRSITYAGMDFQKEKER
jgi:hypothetical protein